MSKFLTTVLFLLILTLSFSAYSMSSSPVNESHFESGYQTIKGRVKQRGTGTIPILVLETSEGEKYLIKGKLQNKLGQLQGFSLLLTGEVKIEKNKSTLSTFNVELYNLDYSLDEDEVSILGQLKKGVSGLVLLTPQQKVVKLVDDSYHSLAKYLGNEIVITGQAEKLDDYQIELAVESYRIIENRE